MIDKEKLDQERDETVKNVLSKIIEAFEAGFDAVHTYGGGEFNITAYLSPVDARAIPHCEVKGFGETPDEALADWQKNLNEKPQAGRALFWRRRPEMEWTRDFPRQKTWWMVYSRFSVDGPR